MDANTAAVAASVVAPGPMLAGQVLLVTGATGEIGCAIVESLVRQGAQVLVHCARDVAGAQQLLERVGGQGWVVQADLSSPQGAEQLWTQCEALAGRVHALVNNAGIRSEVAPEAAIDVWQQTWQREFQVNFFSAVDLCKLAIAHFKRHGGGRIVNMASRAGQRGYAANAMAYGASKAALINLTKSIARSFGGDGITAVAIAPGWVNTRMAQEFVAQHGEQAALGEIPIRQMAEPAEIGDMVAFVLHSANRSLSGSTIDINGASFTR